MTPHGWEPLVLAADVEVLRCLGRLADSAARAASATGVDETPRRFQAAIDALNQGDAEGVVEALRLVAPEFRTPLMDALQRAVE
jgi:hypothetical protein